jgi:hypothetical protein
MKSTTFTFKENNWQGLTETAASMPEAQLILVFADRMLLEKNELNQHLQPSFPKAEIISCSTAGEVYYQKVQQSSAVCVAIQFENTPFSIQSGNIKDFQNSYLLGKEVASKLKQEDLRYIMIISDGNIINGDDLLQGIKEVVAPTVLISGGMAGDGDRFQQTLLGHNQQIAEGNLLLLGMYGDHIQVGTGIHGGWEMFGPERTVSRSAGNVLFEIDDVNALDLYKKYLGKYADELPSSALLFPIALMIDNDQSYLVRTILSVDEQNKSMTFAGNIPEGSTIRFMKSNFDRLVSAAADAGMEAHSSLQKQAPDLTLIVSCVGRKIVLSHRIDEELEAATDGLPANSPVVGFYSYGEFAPLKENLQSYLHNQTMVVTSFSER